MEWYVFAMVVGAAILHATWNALVKLDGDKLAVLAMISITEAVICLVLLPFVDFPAPDAWPFLLVAVAIHTGYKLFLYFAYQFGDLSHVYPLARGSAPLIVAVVSVLVLGEALSGQATLAITIIGLGIISLTLEKRAYGLKDLRPALLALGTGGFIASYTIVDGLGARLAGSPHGYMAWVTLLDAPPFLLIVFMMRGRKAVSMVRSHWRAGIAAGASAYVAYWLVIWALTLAPMAAVAAVRETSIIFAVVIGVCFLKERLNLVRLAAIMTTLTGSVMLKLKN